MSRNSKHGTSSTKLSELASALGQCRSAFVGVGVFSTLINVLMLTGPLFMLQVYDRILPSGSIPTLIGLAVLVAALYGFQAILEGIRARVLTRIGASMDESLSSRVYSLVARLPLLQRLRADGLQPVRDLDQIRGFLSSAGPAALFDVPWVPIYLGVCFLFHPLIGIAAVVGGIFLFIVALCAELSTREPTRRLSALEARRDAHLEATRRSAEAVHAMGMCGRLEERFGATSTDYMTTHRRVSDVVGGLRAVSRGLRLLLQSLVLGLGAYLVIKQNASAGIIIASSILVSRALAPVESAVSNWRGFVASRQAYARLSRLLELFPPSRSPLELPKPKHKLTVQNIVAIPPETQKVVLQDVTFELNAGDALSVIGPNASGKSSLARQLVGVWRPARGKVCLDGANLDQWAPERLGRHIGYLPQNVELFDGTIAENISRFDPDASTEAIIAAAEAAGVHDLILDLADGYETPIGDGGAILSAGQRQRVALARALYGDPFLVVLDEPNANLDQQGDQALAAAVTSVRDRGGIVVVVAHRPSAISTCNHALVLMNGRQQQFGPKHEVLRSLVRPAAA